MYILKLEHQITFITTETMKLALILLHFCYEFFASPPHTQKKLFNPNKRECTINGDMDQS